MLEMIKGDWMSLLIGLVFLLAVVLLYIKDKRMVFQILLLLIEIAEEKYGSKTGPIKHTYVVNQLYKVMPKMIRVVCRPEDIDAWIVYLHKTLKVRLK